MIKNFIKYNSFRFRKKSDFYSLVGHKALKCIYVHIPKTGGVSINKSLYYCLGGGHRTALDYINLFGEETYNSYFSFAVFRDPIQRFISAYNFVFSGGNCLEDELWLEACNFKYDNINDLVNKDLESLINNKVHFQPQIKFITDTNNNVIVDQIIDFQDLEIGFKEVCKKLKINRRLDRLNIKKSNQASYKDLSDSTLQKLKDLYRKDIEFYKYTI